MAAQPPPSTAKKDFLASIERSAQAKWDALKCYEADCPEQFTEEQKDKYFITFPYPYMNGRLHLGHGIFPDEVGSSRPDTCG